MRTLVYEFMSAPPGNTPSLVVLSEVRCVALISPAECGEKTDEWDRWRETMKGKLQVKVCYKNLPSAGTNGASCDSWLPEKEARRVYGDLKILISNGSES